MNFWSGLYITVTQMELVYLIENYILYKSDKNIIKICIRFVEVLLVI